VVYRSSSNSFPYHTHISKLSVQFGSGAWSWTLTSNQCRGEENVDLYIHFPLHLNRVLLNYLSTGTTLPFTESIYNHSRLPLLTIFQAWLCEKEPFPRPWNLLIHGSSGRELSTLTALN
jgi:hypothetical protein